MFRFQIASSASKRPAPRPTRGSGEGASVDIIADDVGMEVLDMEVSAIGCGAQPVMPVMMAKAKSDQSIPVTLHMKHRAVETEPFIGNVGWVKVYKRSLAVVAWHYREMAHSLAEEARMVR